MDEKRSFWAEIRTWPSRRWLVAAASAVAVILVVAIPTDLIDTPFFGRDVPPTTWAWPVLVVTAILSGLVFATYVARKDTAQKCEGSLGAIGAVASFFAVGCPVCNKLVLLALGYGGALQFFEPLQPYLAAGSIILLVVALVQRVKRESTCSLKPKSGGSSMSSSTFRSVDAVTL